MPTRALKDLLQLADSGTWGDPADPATGSPVLRSSNMQDGQLVLDDIAWRLIPAGDVERRRLQTGDIIVTKSSGSVDHIGKCCVFRHPDDERSYYFSNFTLRLRAAPDIADWRWIFYWLTSAIGRQVLAALNNTTTGLRNLSVSQYLEQRVPCPSLPEQRRIADILDKADAVRRKRKESVALTEELLRSTFLEMFGDPVTNPKGWPARPLGELLRFLTSGSRGWATHYAESGDLFLRIQNVCNDCLDLADVAYVRAPDTAEARRTKVEAGDVLLSITADLGRTAVVPNGLPRAFINQHLAILRTGDVEPEYLSAFLASAGGQRQFQRLNRHGVKAGLNFDDIRGVQVLVPPISKQRRFVRVKLEARELQQLLLRASAEADTLMKALVQSAFRAKLTQRVVPYEAQLNMQGM